MNIGKSLSPQNMLKTVKKAASSVKSKLTKNGSSKGSKKMSDVDYKALETQYTAIKTEMENTQRLMDKNIKPNTKFKD